MFPIGHSSPDRWVAMLDTFNDVTGSQAVFSEDTIYNEFHRDTTWYPTPTLRWFNRNSGYFS
ncbi:MAG: hypothetical protein ACJA1X_002386, partial [Bermanella sp.]